MTTPDLTTTNLGTSDSTPEPRAHRSLWWLLAAAAIAIAWRAPLLLWQARFWGEEGSLYFAYARQQGLLASLFFVPTSDFPAGYLLLAASLPATVASLVSLEWAPLVTTSFAFLVQLTPIAVVLAGESPLWRAKHQKAIVCAVLIVAPAVVGEVWLNTINSQVFCGLIAALILVSEAPTGRLGRLVQGLLVFCGLSGPYTAFLAPVFWLRTTLRTKIATSTTDAANHPGRVTQWRIVLATAVVQASIFLWTSATFPLAPERFEAGRWALRSAAAAYHFVLRSLFGETLGLGIADGLGLRRPLGSIAEAYWLPVTAPADASPWVGLIALGLIVAVLCWLGRRAHPWAHLLTVALVLSGGLITLSIGHLYPAGRYAVVPGTLLLIRIAVATWDEGPIWRRRSAGCLLAVALLAGVVEYRQETPVGVFGSAPDRPTWTDELATWRADPDYALRIWPYNLDVPNRLALSSAADAGADLRAFEAASFRLTSTGEWATWRLPAGELPDDFRLVVDFETSRPVGELEVEARWSDPLGRPLYRWPVERCSTTRRCRLTLDRHDLRALDEGRDRPIHGLELALRSPRATPARLEVTRLRVARRLEGALEPLLSTRRAAGQQRPLVAGEATALAMVESWRLDGDLAFDDRDLDRARARWAPGTPIELRRDDDRLAYRGSAVHALFAGTLTGGQPTGLLVLNLLLSAALIAWANRRGAPPAVAVPVIVASWASVHLLSPTATWTLAFVLWVVVATDLRSRLRRPLVEAVALGGLAASICLDSPIFVPLALAASCGRFALRREPKAAAVSLASTVVLLVALGSLVERVGGQPWWSTGEPVVLAPAAFDPEESRALVIPQARATERGVGSAENTLWAIPGGPVAPLFAYPLLVLWAAVWIREARRAPDRPADGRLIGGMTGAAVLASAALAWFLSPVSRVGPSAWAALYPLILIHLREWPPVARRLAQGLAVLWCLAVLRALL